MEKEGGHLKIQDLGRRALGVWGLSRKTPPMIHMERKVFPR